jgi:hypothetical protein
MMMKTETGKDRLLAILFVALVGTVGVLIGITLDRTLLAPRGVEAGALSAAADSAGAPGGIGADTAPTSRVGGPGRLDADAVGRALRARAGDRLMEWISGEVELTPEQRERMEGILADRMEEFREVTEELRPRYREIVRETRRDLARVLTPEQRARLREAVRERIRERRP